MKQEVLRSVLILYFVLPTNAAFFGRFFGFESSPPESSRSTTKPRVIAQDNLENGPSEPSDFDASKVEILFELSPLDTKFLEEVEKFTDVEVSPLEACQLKVVVHAQSSCSEMSEEDLGMLGVNLLNCQSALEGRTTYLCSSGMSLRECTKDMDSITWNSYLLMSNRAQAICYSIRQQLFRAKTEMTVNKLLYSADEQLNRMNKLQQNQQELGETVSGTYNFVAQSQKELINQQHKLQLAQHGIKSYVASNLAELTREKALIASGHKELASMTESIKQKLEEAHTQLINQDNERHLNHDELIHDLERIEMKANEIWSKIEFGMDRILQRHREADAQYDNTLQHFEKMNKTVMYILSILEQTKDEVDKNFSWFSDILEGRNVRLLQIYILGINIGYLVFGMIIAAFVQAPIVTRVALLLLVPMNAGYQLCHDTNNGAFNIIYISGAIFVISVTYLAVQKERQISIFLTKINSFWPLLIHKFGCFMATPVTSEGIPAVPINTSDADANISVEHDISTLDASSADLVQDTSADSNLTKNNSYGVDNDDSFVIGKRQVKNNNRSNSSFLEMPKLYPSTMLARSRSSTPLSDVSTASRRRCASFTNKNHLCKNLCAPNEISCHLHKL